VTVVGNREAKLGLAQNSVAKIDLGEIENVIARSVRKQQPVFRLEAILGHDHTGISDRRAVRADRNVRCRGGLRLEWKEKQEERTQKCREIGGKPRSDAG
jgi:hypothetical protein